MLRAQFGNEVLQRFAVLVGEIVRELPAQDFADGRTEPQLLLRIFEERRERSESTALRALPQPFVGLKHLRHGGTFAERLLDDLVTEFADQFLDTVTHLLVVSGQAGCKVQDVARGFHGLFVIQQAIEFAGADVLHKLLALLDLLFEGFQTGALVGLVSLASFSTSPSNVPSREPLRVERSLERLSRKASTRAAASVTS